MNILYAATKNLYPQLQASIRSLLDHNKVTKLYIFAEDDELPFEIPCPNQIINVKGQEYFPKSSPVHKSGFTYMSAIRACAPDLIKANKVIYLDVDTIVCDSLKPLWTLDLEGKWIAWCPEYRGFWNPYRHEFYYNMGVCVMNLAQLRKDNIVETAVERLNTIPYQFPEQDLFNEIAVPEKTVTIPVRYNECFFCGFTDNPAIVHYAGFRNWATDKGLFRREYLDKYLN